MTDLQFIRADELLGVQPSDDGTSVRIRFRQNTAQAALQFPFEQSEGLARSLADMIFEMAGRPAALARNVEKMALSATLEGVTLTLGFEGGLDAETIHLAQNHIETLHAALGDWLEGQSNMTVQ